MNLLSVIAIYSKFWIYSFGWCKHNVLYLHKQAMITHVYYGCDNKYGKRNFRWKYWGYNINQTIKTKNVNPASQLTITSIIVF